MPGRDGTGPARAAGNWDCRKGGIMPGYRAGRAFGKDDGKEMRNARLKMMETQKDAIKKRLGELGF